MGVVNQTDFLHKNVEYPAESGGNFHDPSIVKEILEHAIADEAVLSVKTKNARWNLSKPGFANLINIYKVQYTQLADISEEISKVSRALKSRPIVSIEKFLTNTRLDESSGIIPDVMQLIADHENIILYYSDDYRRCAKRTETPKISALLLNLIRQHEKMVWVLRSYIKEEPIDNESQVRN